MSHARSWPMSGKRRQGGQKSSGYRIDDLAGIDWPYYSRFVTIAQDRGTLLFIGSLVLSHTPDKQMTRTRYEASLIEEFHASVE